ncbi:MAG: cysteine desulfurase family protein [Verrucomicrobiia bacterium]
MLYFDHNATSPMIPEAREAWLEASERYIGNPSSLHRMGDRADKALALAREELAGLLGCETGDIVWTSGATESSNTVLRQFSENPTGVAWVSAIEHPCVDVPTRHFFAKRNRFMPVTEAGVLDVERLKVELGRRRPGIIATMAANNETGVRQPWQQVLELSREAKVPYFCDATQWLGKLAAAGLGDCDYVSGSGHKFGGPRGVGFLKCPSGSTKALLFGGAQEDGRRAGTENVPGVLAMVRALSVREGFIKAGKVDERLKMRDDFISQVQEKLPECQVLGAACDRLWNTVSMLMPGNDCRQRWIVKLDKAGFAVSSGSACASGKEEPSHVLRAMGVAPEDTGRVIRISSSWETGSEDWNRLLAAIRGVHAELGAEG